MDGRRERRTIAPLTSGPPPDRNLLASLGRSARQSADRRALVHGDQDLSFQGLAVASDAVAHALVRSGIAPGARIAYLGRTAVEYYVLLVGAMKAGAVTVPLNWRAAVPELVDVVDDCAAALIVTDEEYLPIAQALRPSSGQEPLVVALGGTVGVRWEDWIRGPAAERLADRFAEPEDVVLQLYTSGTTGRPKGVMHTHASLTAYLDTMSDAAGISADAVSLSCLPHFHVGGTCWTLAALHRGATTVLLREAKAQPMLDVIAALRITHLIAVPTVIAAMTEEAADRADDYSSLDTVYYGGSPIPETTLTAAMGRFCCGFVQGYGLTEHPLVSVLDREAHFAGGSSLLSCGRAVPGAQVRLVDPATLVDVPEGQVGEILVRSALGMQGYWGRPEATSATILAGGWIRTGDAASLASDGLLYLHDRVKDVIITGGENVYSAEVENALVKHPDVAAAAVIGLPSPTWGETVAAVVVLRPETAASADSLAAHCRSLLAAYKCPRAVFFADSLPLTPAGKTMKHVLRTTYRQPPTLATPAP